MSYGFTGLVIEEKAKVGLFNCVSVNHLETYETKKKLTSYWHEVASYRFKTSYLAKKFAVCVNTKRIQKEINILIKEKLIVVKNRD